MLFIYFFQIWSTICLFGEDSIPKHPKPLRSQTTKHLNFVGRLNSRPPAIAIVRCRPFRDSQHHEQKSKNKLDKKNQDFSKKLFFCDTQLLEQKSKNELDKRKQDFSTNYFIFCLYLFLSCRLQKLV